MPPGPLPAADRPQPALSTMGAFIGVIVVLAAFIALLVPPTIDGFAELNASIGQVVTDLQKTAAGVRPGPRRSSRRSSATSRTYLSQRGSEDRLRGVDRGPHRRRDRGRRGARPDPGGLPRPRRRPPDPLGGRPRAAWQPRPPQHRPGRVRRDRPLRPRGGGGGVRRRVLHRHHPVDPRGADRAAAGGADVRRRVPRRSSARCSRGCWRPWWRSWPRGGSWP